LPVREKRDETYYLIGIDVGNDSSAIAFFNLSTNSPETIDISGGYGKPSIPTAVQYISETKEWVFGEYAVMNRSSGEVFTSLIERMGKFDHVNINGQPMKVAHILGLFVKELLSNVKNINPKAEIAGIVANVPAYFSDEAEEEFREVFFYAGYGEELIALVPDRECVLAHHYRDLPDREEQVLLLDFGNRELRGGLYKVNPMENGINVKSISSVFDDKISMSLVDKCVRDLLESLFMSASENPVHGSDFSDQMEAFTLQHKDMLFQKSIRVKPVKLYYNFAYPPVQQTLSREIVDKLVEPYAKDFNRFLGDVMKKNIDGVNFTLNDIVVVLCVGGGFEMLWARETIENLFARGKALFIKSPKLVNAEGAALIAARKTGFSVPTIHLEDNHQLTCDIGFIDTDNFIALVMKKSFWWQKHSPKLFFLNCQIDGDICLSIGKREESSNIRQIGKIQLDGLPIRPKGVTRLKVELVFSSHTNLVLTISDTGFGDLYPKTDYYREFFVKLGE